MSHSADKKPALRKNEREVSNLEYACSHPEPSMGKESNVAVEPTNERSLCALPVTSILLYKKKAKHTSSPPPEISDLSPIEYRQNSWKRKSFRRTY